MTRWGILLTAKIAMTHTIPALVHAQGCEVMAIYTLADSEHLMRTLSGTL